MWGKGQQMDVKLSSIIISLIVVSFSILAVRVLHWVWFKPKRLEKFLRKQGFNGNQYRFLLGDMKDFIRAMKQEQPKSIDFSNDDISSHILPYYHQIIAKYGKNSIVWMGPSPRLNITDPELIKEILTKPKEFHKPVPDPIGKTIVGGLLYLEDDQWATRRKIVNPAFHMEKLKSVVGPICLSCSHMIEKWESLASGGEKSTREIDVWPYIEDLSGDVISRTAFGISHGEGRKIFELQREQVKLALKVMLFSFIPGWRHFPTKTNRRMKSVVGEIHSLLKGIINQREKATERGESFNDDLLGILMESNLKEIQEHGNNNMGMSIEDVIEECKLFYFAGSETTSNLLAWTMVLLSKHQDWQARAREEVLLVFGRKEPTVDGLNQLKIVTMILQEVLRLYPAVPVIVRAAAKMAKLGNMDLPSGVQLTLLIGLLHRDPKIWGDDANVFKPERFSEGISSATNTKHFSYIPFSSGPRVCIGQNFSMIQAKIAMAMILQHFKFELSASYKHAPFSVITLQPQHGVPLILQKL
ncbi:cytochrome P450 CYP72A219-like [Henckelia pumila]|uniref:cytochrome P450 CYP72A219-like n=1 Tax=Henckelia pumila TaxID=405737 RepID=UPI003C6E2B3F